MTFVAGLVWGIVIAALQVASEHYGPAFGPATPGGAPAFSLSGNGALAVPVVLIPLALFWGWNWIASGWSGRTLIPTIAFTAGLYLGVGLAAPADALLFPQGPESTLANSLPAVVFIGAILVLPTAVLAGAIYYVLTRERFPASGPLVAVLYLISVPLGLVLPMITMGVVAGTAAGHAWGWPQSRLLAGILVIVLMLVAVFGLPYLLSGARVPL